MPGVSRSGAVPGPFRGDTTDGQGLAANAWLKPMAGTTDLKPESMRAPEPLTFPAFRRLAFSYTLNELSWAFGTIALGILVFDRTGSAAATTALFLLTAFVPAVFAS